MNGLNKLAKSAVIVFAGTIIGQVLGLLAELFIIQSVSVNTLGRLGLAYALVSTIGTVSLVGVPAGVTRLLSGSSKRSDSDILTAGLVITLSISALSFTFIRIYRQEVLSILSIGNVGGFLDVLSIYLLLLPVDQILFSGIRARGKTRLATLAKWIGPRMIAIPTLIIYIYVIDSPVTGAILYWILIPFLTGVFSLLVYRFYLRNQVMSRPSLHSMKRLWRFSWPLAISASLSILLSRLDILMLSAYVDATSVGYYRSIQPLREITTFVSGAFGFMFLPLASDYFDSNRTNKLQELYVVSTKWVSSITLPFVLVFCLFSDDVIRVFLGPKYIPASLALSILIGGLYFRSLVGLNTDLIKAVDRTKIELLCALLGVISNILLNFLLIPRYGIIGAAIATVGGFIIYNSSEVFIIYAVVDVLPFNIRNLLAIVLTSLFGTLSSILTTHLELSLVILLVIGIILTCVHLVILIMTGALTSTDLFFIDSIEDRLGIDIPYLKAIINE